LIANAIYFNRKKIAPLLGSFFNFPVISSSLLGEEPGLIYRQNGFEIEGKIKKRATD
jgi:hypothetical protein